MVTMGRRWSWRDPLLVGWALCAVVTSVAVGRVATHDVTAQPVVADQSSYLLQALSLAYDRDLVFDQGDLAIWTDADWTPVPSGLYAQRRGDTVTFAKPYVYSALLAVPVKAFGVRWGVALTNAALLLVTVAAVAALLARRVGGAAAPLFTTGLVLVSSVALSAFSIGVELFFAAGVAAAVLAAVLAREGRRGAAVACAVIVAVLVAEKAPMALALGPVLAAVAWDRPRWRSRLAVVGVAAATFGLAVLPYLWASDGASLSPYGGERYASYAGRLPTDAELALGPEVVQRVGTDEVFSPSYAWTTLGEDPEAKGWAVAYYVAGEHTGLLVWVPAAAVGLALALASVRRWSSLGRVAGLGLLAYVAFYVLLFPGNYYGGGQSVGNRYFVQVAPLVALIVAEAAIPARRLLAGAAVGSVAGAVVLAPHLLSPGDALVRMDRTSPVQRLFVFEGEVDGVRYFDRLEIPANQRPTQPAGATGA